MWDVVTYRKHFQQWIRKVLNTATTDIIDLDKNKGDTQKHTKLKAEVCALEATQELFYYREHISISVCGCACLCRVKAMVNTDWWKYGILNFAEFRLKFETSSSSCLASSSPVQTDLCTMTTSQVEPESWNLHAPYLEEVHQITINGYLGQCF